VVVRLVGRFGLDLVEMGQYTEFRWGEKQRDKYLGNIDSCLYSLAKKPGVYGIPFLQDFDPRHCPMLTAHSGLLKCLAAVLLIHDAYSINLLDVSELSMFSTDRNVNR